MPILIWPNFNNVPVTKHNAKTSGTQTAAPKRRGAQMSRTRSEAWSLS